MFKLCVKKLPKRQWLSKLFIMKKLIVCLFICLGLVIPANKAQAMDPKSKAFLVVCGYGTVGGALLGFASLAFGTNSRAVAQGASLGLYAGIIFGTYVLTSYNTGGSDYEFKEPAYPNDPYPPAGGYPPPGGGYGAPPPVDDGGFFGSPRRVIEINQELTQKFGTKKGTNTPPIYMNLLNYQF